LLAFLLPSIADLIFIILFFALTYGSLAPAMLGDADIGWHIRNGENILATRAVPHVDTFSATMAGRTWFAWEWLYDALIAWIHRAAGLNGVVAFSAFCVALTFSFVFRWSLKNGGALATSVVLLLFSIMASSIHFLARPHVVGWLLTIIWFWILDQSQRSTLEGRADPTPICLPVLMILWVNLHGSFVMGFVLLGIYFLADVLTAYRSRNEQLRPGAVAHARMVAAVSLMTALTSLLNPYGYKLHVHVYQYLSSPFFMQHIEEFRRPDFHRAPTQFFVLLLAVTVIAILLARAQLRWSEWLVIAFSSFSGLWAARNLPVSSMLLTLTVAPILSRCYRGQTFHRWQRLLVSQQRFTALETRLRGHLWPIVLVVSSAAVCLNQGVILGRQALNAHFDPNRFPVQAVDFMVRHGYREPIFSLDSYGGYLIYRLYPAQKVFIDDRHDFYGEEYLRKYLKVLHVEPDWQAVLDENHVDLIVMPTRSKISDALRQSEVWRGIYSDNTAALFERSAR
jgi:hypothetical protein